jgi:hypothetical protein
MPFQYSCFISYRRLDDDMEIVKDLYDAITAEIRRLVPQEVYRDEERLRGGEIPETQIATALCRSLCMIVFYVPVYFDEGHTYCAREYRAMELLEEQRLEGLRMSYGDDVGGYGLIIPIIFRGAKFLPPEFRERRKPYIFEDFTISTRDIRNHPLFLEQVKAIADYIFERSLEFDAIADSAGDCHDFALPPDGEDLRQWVRVMRPAPMRSPRVPPAFPFRTAGQ